MEEKTIDISKYLLHNDSESDDTAIDFNCDETENTSSISSSSDLDEEFSKNSMLTKLIFTQSSKELQVKLLHETNYAKISKIVNNVKGSYLSLIFGKNSNYFISVLIQKATKMQKIEILEEIEEDIPRIAINEFASHPLQTIIEKASSKILD